MIAAPAGANNVDNSGDSNHHAPPGANDEAGGNFTGPTVTANNVNSSGRRHQLYVGNLTWVCIILFIEALSIYFLN